MRGQHATACTFCIAQVKVVVRRLVKMIKSKECSGDSEKARLGNITNHLLSPRCMNSKIMSCAVFFCEHEVFGADNTVFNVHCFFILLSKHAVLNENTIWNLNELWLSQAADTFSMLRALIQNHSKQFLAVGARARVSYPCLGQQFLRHPAHKARLWNVVSKFTRQWQFASYDSLLHSFDKYHCWARQ